MNYRRVISRTFTTLIPPQLACTCYSSAWNMFVDKISSAVTREILNNFTSTGRIKSRHRWFLRTMTQHDFTVILNLAVRRLISCILIPLNDTSSLNFRFPRKHLTGNISTLCDSLTINMSWRKEEFLHQPCVYSAGFAPRLF